MSSEPTASPDTVPTLVAGSEAAPAAETQGERADGSEPGPEAVASAPPEKAEIRRLREARDENRAVEGRIIGWNNGGFHVVVDGVTAFCPRSEMEIGSPRKPSAYLDQTHRFKVLKIQKRGRRVVLSRAALLKGDRERRRNELRAQLQPGAVLQGSVASISDFGAFVDLGGLQGLVHVSELSRERVAHPSDSVQVGQTVTVKVLKVEQGGKRISLSMRALEPDPWRDIKMKYPAGSMTKGTVEKTTSFGAFVELEPGLTGLLPSSQMGIPRESSPARLFPPCKEVSVQILAVDAKRHRISLGLEGSGVEGTRGDYQAYRKQQGRAGASDGFNALADAFKKLRKRPD